MKLGPYLLGPNDDENCGIYTGDARELAQAIPDESIDLIFTDPVYDRIDDYRWLAETGARVLVPSGDVLTYLGMYHMGPIVCAMAGYLNYRWLLVEKKLTSGTLIWSYRLFTHFVPILWFTKGIPRKADRIDFMWSQGEGNGVNHRWAKGARRCSYWLRKFGAPGDVILDPFCGGGAVPASCRTVGRRYLAFEIDPATAELARERVRHTQPPLFVPQPEQASLFTQEVPLEMEVEEDA